MALPSLRLVVVCHHLWDVLGIPARLLEGLFAPKAPRRGPTSRMEGGNCVFCLFGALKKSKNDLRTAVILILWGSGKSNMDSVEGLFTCRASQGPASIGKDTWRPSDLSAMRDAVGQPMRFSEPFYVLRLDINLQHMMCTQRFFK